MMAKNSLKKFLMNSKQKNSYLQRYQGFVFVFVSLLCCCALSILVQDLYFLVAFFSICVVKCQMPYQRLQKGQKLKIPSRLQLRSTVFVNDFTPQKWLYLSIEFNQTVKNKYTSLVVRAPVFVLIGPIRASQKGPKLKILLRLQFHIMVSVNEFTPHKWLS